MKYISDFVIQNNVMNSNHFSSALILNTKLAVPTNNKIMMKHWKYVWNKKVDQIFQVGILLQHKQEQ